MFFHRLPAEFKSAGKTRERPRRHLFFLICEWVLTGKFLLPALTFCLSIALPDNSICCKSFDPASNPFESHHRHYHLSHYRLIIFRKYFFLPFYQKIWTEILHVKTAVKGNLLKGITDKTVRTQGLTKLHPLFTYVCSLLGNTLFNIKKWFKIAGFPKIFLYGNLYITNIVCKSWKKEKKKKRVTETFD